MLKRAEAAPGTLCRSLPRPTDDANASGATAVLPMPAVLVLLAHWASSASWDEAWDELRSMSALELGLVEVDVR